MAEGLNCLFDMNLRNKPLMSYINFILNDHKFKIATVKQSGLATLSIESYLTFNRVVTMGYCAM